MDLFSLMQEENTAPEAENEILKAADERYKKLGQFFTPEPIAEIVAEVGKSLCEHLLPPVVVIDPAAGEGALLRPFKNEPGYKLFAVEIDPKLRKELSKVAENTYTKDGLSVLVRLTGQVGGVLPPVNLILMNPPYNLQITLPSEAQNFISAREEYGTSRYTAKSEMAFLEAGLRVVGKSRWTALISIHTENHREAVEHLIKKLAEEEILIKASTLKIGRAFPEVEQDFFILTAVRTNYHSFVGIEEAENKEDLLLFAAINRLPRLATTYDISAKLKKIISQGEISRKFSAEEILPEINLKGTALVAKKTPLLLFYSQFTELQHPLTDEKIDLVEALRTSLVPLIAKDPILRSYFTVPLEKIPPPAELVSLSPPTPLQQLAFASPGMYTAKADLVDENGKLIIEKGKEYLIRNIIEKRRVTTETETHEITREFYTRIIQVISPEDERVILEVQI